MELEPIQKSVSSTARNLLGKVPEQLKNAVELRWGLQLYFDAFFDLDTERSHGSGYTRIPWSRMVAYAEFYDFSEDQTNRLITHIQVMDRAFIKKLSDDADAKRNT